MGEDKLKTAVLGLDGRGELLLEAAYKSGHFQIQAVADKDADLAERVAAKYKCAAYDDYRQLIIEMDSRLRGDSRCLLVAAGIHSCDEYVRMAMKKKFNVLKLAPAARNFEEAAEFVRLGEDEDIKFAIANPLRFAQSFLALRQFLQENRIEQTFGTPNAIKSVWEPFLITAICNVGDEFQPGWQTDPKLAGGGVLLRNCYGIIDQIMCNFPVPQQIYSLSTSQAADRQQRLRLTEDTAVVTMKFTDTLIGNLTASRRADIGPRQEFLKIYGKDKILTVSNTRFVVSDASGQVSEELEYDDDQFVWYTALLENFALSILLPDENELCSSGRENLKDMAVIESAYLSARTAMPEEPGRILEMAH